MTIPTSQSSETFIGNGITNTFDFSFVGYSASYITVIYTDAEGATTTLSPSQYTIFLNAPATGALWGIGGTVTYPTSGSPIDDGTLLTVTRTLPLTQVTSISNQGDFAPQVIESALDTLEMQIQQVSGRSGAFRGEWITDTVYNYADIVIDGANGNNTSNWYICALANTSGVWADDLAAGDWVLILDITTVGPISVVFGTTNRITVTNGTTAPIIDIASTYVGQASITTVGTLTTGTANILINEKHGADIASASTINLTTATGNYVYVTGTTSITAVTLAEGYERVVKFSGILTLTNGASLILPGGANITTAAGDIAVFRGEAAGVVRVTQYERIASSITTLTPGTSANNLVQLDGSAKLPAVDGSQLTNLNITTTPGSIAAWVNFNGTGTLAVRDSLNVTSVTDNGTGDYTVNFSFTWANDNYAYACNNEQSTGSAQPALIGSAAMANGTYISKITTAMRIHTILVNFDASGLTDAGDVNLLFVGDR